MEADALKKIQLYCAVAVVLGLLLTLVPSVIIKGEKANERAMLFYEESEEPKGAYGLATSKYSVADFEILALSFIFAFVVYVLLKWRIPH
jgi:hypothetical protein